MTIDLGEIDDFTYRRAVESVERRIREIRECGLMVTVVEDYEIAALVDIRSDGEPPSRMLIPSDLIRPHIKAARAG